MAKALLFIVIFLAACAEKQHSEIQLTGLTTAAIKPTDDRFTPVKEMLSVSCAPCHNPGGKMYDRLPFDDPGTVRSHSTAILRRLTDPNQEILQKWIREEAP